MRTLVNFFSKIIRNADVAHKNCLTIALEQANYDRTSL